MARKRKKVSEEKEMDGSDGSDGSHINACGSPVTEGEKSASQGNAAYAEDIDDEKSAELDSFYQRLCKLNESSGLSLVFNFRETTFDLFLFYKAVTERGGFHQVTKDGKWGEVALALNFESSVSISQTQLQSLYVILFQKFEQMYHYRTPTISAPGLPEDSDDSSSCLSGKRKRHDISAPLLTVDSGNRDGQGEKMKGNSNSGQLLTDVKIQGGPETGEQKPPRQASLKDKEMLKDPNAPQRNRSSYQIFLKTECYKLKKLHGESSGTQNFREMAIEAWRRLSESGRQPYVEASMMDKERFNREMAAYKELKNRQNMTTLSSSSKLTILNFSATSRTDGDYYATPQPDAAEFYVPNEPEIESAVQLMKNARPNDPKFQNNCDEYFDYSNLDISS